MFPTFPPSPSHSHLRLLAQVEISLAQQQHEYARDGRKVESSSPAEPPRRRHAEAISQEVKAQQASEAAEQPESCLEGQRGAEHRGDPAEEDEDRGRAVAAQIVQAHVVLGTPVTTYIYIFIYLFIFIYVCIYRYIYI